MTHLADYSFSVRSSAFGAYEDLLQRFITVDVWYVNPETETALLDCGAAIYLTTAGYKKVLFPEHLAHVEHNSYYFIADRAFYLNRGYHTERRDIDGVELCVLPLSDDHSDN